LIQTFTYSPTGNILTKSDMGSYQYEKTNNANPQAVTTVGAGANLRTYQYDKNGNMITGNVSGVTSTYTFDYRDRMVKSKKGTNPDVIYGYDHTYNRVKKWDKNGNKVSLYPFGDYEIEGTANASGVLTTTTTQRVNTGVGGGQSASREFNGSGVLQNSIWHHTDHLTGSSIETNSAGVLIQTLDYNPFGSVRTNTKTTSYDNKKKYTGKELDGETNLMYYGARYYDAEIGRWMGVDPLVLSPASKKFMSIMGDPQQVNYYQYTRNNPMKYVDPTGMYNVETGEIEKGDTKEGIVEQVNKVHGTSDTWEVIALIQDIDPNADLVIGMKLYVGTESTVQIDGSMNKLFDIVEKEFESHKGSIDFYLDYFDIKPLGDNFGTKKKYDLKNLKGSDARSCTFGMCAIGTNKDGSIKYARLNWAYVFEGKLLRYDAPGNILFGYATAHFGLSESGTHWHVDRASPGGKDNPYDEQRINQGRCIYFMKSVGLCS